jgi:hypothetical protein
MTALLFAALAAIDAPVTQVTVFTDQARVVRTAQVQVSGQQTIELPPLRDGVDLASVRVEAQGAEVRRVDIERIAPEKLRTDEAKALLAEIDKVDVTIERLTLERQALEAQRDALQRLVPSAPVTGAMQAPAKLNAGGWQASATFSVDQLTKVHGRLRDLGEQSKQQGELRAKLLEKAEKLGNPRTTSGWQVTAQLAGNGPATVTLTYLVGASRWTPSWDLQLQPDTNTVNLSLAGLVSQDTGEDWSNASLVLSTAIPSRATKAPRLATWKIGVADRFIPTPSPVWSPVAPPPPLRSTSSVPTEEQLIRERLMRLGISQPLGQTTPRPVMDFSGEDIEGELVRPEAEVLDEARRVPQKAQKYRPPAQAGKRTRDDMPAAPPPPSMAPAAEAMPGAYRTSSVVAGLDSDEAEEDRPAQPVSTFSLAPPPAWRPPQLPPDSPVMLAQGYDLSFTSLQRETVPSSRGARRVALWSANWPVTVERKLFPALTTDAFLVAELKNPSQQVLPGGPAQLYVGADPAGTARLKLVSPGEPFTLPLGIDRALKPVRNVQLVEETKGVFSKDEIGTYTVTIELANPYRAPVAVRVADQWPVTDQKEVEVKLLDTKPTAIQDQKRGGLEWRLTIPPQQKQVFSFTYTLKRPRGWKLQQQEVVR